MQANDKLISHQLKDLKHRFLGEGHERSFQVDFIRSTGGAVAHFPINWGWRAGGGFSIGGLLLGSGAFLDALISSKFSQNKLLGRFSERTGISGLHVFHKPSAMLKRHFRDYVLDLFRSREVRECGLFDGRRLEDTARDHFSARGDHAGDLICALDLALAARIFKVRRGA